MGKIVRDLVKEYMVANGYTALCSDYCGCVLDELMPCNGDQNINFCEVGYANNCETCTKREGCGNRIQICPDADIFCSSERCLEGES